MIIFGTKVRKKTMRTGQFFCPRCRTTRPFNHQKGTRYFTLYFVPLIPMGDVGEFIECDVCHGTFQLDVLKMKPAPARADLAGMLNTLKTRLEGGVPIEYAVRDLTAAGLELDTARTAVKNALPVERNVCKTCGLSYAPNVTTCTVCQGTIDPSQS